MGRYKPISFENEIKIEINVKAVMRTEIKFTNKLIAD